MKNINPNLYPKSLEQFDAISKAVSQQLKSTNIAAAFLNSTNKTLSGVYSVIGNNSAFAGFDSLFREASRNKILANKVASYFSSQLYLSNNLIQISKAVDQSHLNKFNALNVAFGYITKSFINDIVKSKDWTDVDIAEQVNERIINASDNYTNHTTAITQDDLHNLGNTIISELSGLLLKTRNEKTIDFILRLITIFSFLIAMYTSYQQIIDKTNQEVIDETKIETNKIRTEIKSGFVKQKIENEQNFELLYEQLSQKIEQEFNKLNKKRVSLYSVKLKKTPTNNSPQIGKIKAGQEVIVVEIQNKYLLITYIDKETNMPKSGFVLKKHFKKIK